MIPFLWWLPFTAALCATLMLGADGWIARLVLARKAEWWADERFWRGWTELADSTWWLTAAALAFALAWARLRRVESLFWARLKRHSTSILIVTLASGAALNLLKILFARPRPRLLFREGLYDLHWARVGSDYGSFPSGHTTTVFALATLLGRIWPRGRWVFLACAALSGVSRVMLGSHYPADVVAGAYLGMLCAMAAWGRMPTGGMFKAE